MKLDVLALHLYVRKTITICKTLQINFMNDGSGWILSDAERARRKNLASSIAAVFDFRMQRRADRRIGIDRLRDIMGSRSQRRGVIDHRNRRNRSLRPVSHSTVIKIVSTYIHCQLRHTRKSVRLSVSSSFDNEIAIASDLLPVGSSLYGASGGGGKTENRVRSARLQILSVTQYPRDARFFSMHV